MLTDREKRAIRMLVTVKVANQLLSVEKALTRELNQYTMFPSLSDSVNDEDAVTYAVRYLVDVMDGLSLTVSDC